MKTIEKFLCGENLNIEYKDDSSKNFDIDTVICACVGMANAEGGVVLIAYLSDKPIIPV